MMFSLMGDGQWTSIALDFDVTGAVAMMVEDISISKGNGSIKPTIL